MRTLKGYDEYNTILLPPRAPGDPLPKQLLEHYEKVNKPTSDTNVPVTINEMDPVTRKVVLSPTKAEFEEKGDYCVVFVVNIYCVCVKYITGFYI